MTYEETMSVQLKEWNSKIESKIEMLQSKAENANKGEKANYLKEIDELQIQQVFLQDRLNELRKTIHEAWNEMNIEINYTWNILKKTINQSIFVAVD
jgi:hypothetical protein